MRVFKIILSSLLAIFLFNISIFADEGGEKFFNLDFLDKAINERNAIIKNLKEDGSSTFISDTPYYNRAYVNEDFFVKYGLIVNSKVEDGKPVFELCTGLFQEQDDSGEFRYLGNNTIGETISNPRYEAVVSNDFEKKNWIKNDDYKNIKKTRIGKGLREDNPFNKDEFIERYYSNFISGFVRDFGDKLSDNFMLEYNLANKEFLKRLNGRNYETLTDAEKKELDSLFKYVGQSVNFSTEKIEYPMKDFIRIASIPGDYSNGLAYMFHRGRNGVYYYLGVSLDSNYIKYEDIVAVDSKIQIDSTDKNYAYGRYDFNIFSTGDIKSYKITCLDNGVNLSGKLSDDFKKGIKEYRDSYDLIALLNNSNRLISIEIEVENYSGKKSRQVVSVELFSSGNIVSKTVPSVIASNKRGREVFDVSRGIPSGSELYCNIFCEEYISNSNYKHHTGTKVFYVYLKKNYKLKWTNPLTGKEEVEIVTLKDSVSISRSYSYYTIDSFALYRASRAKVYSDIFEDGEIDIDSSRVPRLNLELERYKEHMYNPLKRYNISLRLGTEIIDGGYSRPSIPEYDFYSEADSAVPSLKVRNDKVVFKGLTISDGDYVNSNTAKPLDLPNARIVDKNFFYKEGNKIPVVLSNGIHSAKAEIIYNAVKVINAPSSVVKRVNDINKVLVHSPVVAYPKCESRLDIVQKNELDESLCHLVIGDSFNVNFSCTGSHKNILGYGNRDYSSTTKARQLKFDFDVFRGEDYSGEYLRRGEWIDITDDNTRFFIPSWVNEKDTSNVFFRALANNYSADLSSANNFQRNHNIDYNSYKAVELIKVVLVPKVYDFKIRDVRDPSFKEHFKKASGYFKVGDKNNLGNSEPSINYLPVTGYKNNVKNNYGQHLKLGYKFRYSFKTSGDMFRKGDVAVIRPTYKLLDKYGNKIDVDLYYKKGNSLKPISYKLKNSLVLNTKGRRISKNTLKKTAFIRGSLLSSTTYIKEYRRLLKKRGYNINFYGNMLLSSRQRTYIGDFNRLALRSGLRREDLISSVQEWHGDFYLPASTVAVKKGSKLRKYGSLDVNKAPFFQKGLIVVNFKIDIYHNITNVFDIDKIKPYISYSSEKYGNQWEREGYQIDQKFGDSNVRFGYGDVAVYYLNKRAYDNYK